MDGSACLAFAAMERCGSVTEGTIAAELWSALEGLGAGLDPNVPTVATVRVVLESGDTLEVFRAEAVDAPMAAWRVRGFTDGTKVRLAAILGTRDGRALVTERVGPDDGPAVVGGLVARVEKGQRSLDDLSAAIAAAILELMGPSS